MELKDWIPLFSKAIIDGSGIRIREAGKHRHLLMPMYQEIKVQRVL